MGLFDFLKTAEKKKQRAVGQVFSFLRDTVDPDTEKDKQKRLAQGRPATYKEDVSQDFVRRNLTPGGLAKNAINIGREVVTRPAVTAVQSLREVGEKQATSATVNSINELKSLSPEERNKAVANNEGLKLLLDNKGVRSYDDKSLDDAIAQAQQRDEQSTNTVNTEDNPLLKAVLGGTPVKTYQERAKGNEQTLKESRFRDVAVPFSFLGAGLSVGLDAPGFGAAKTAGKSISKEVVEQLAKESTAVGVKKLLSNVRPPEVVDKIAEAIAMTKDKSVIKNIIGRSDDALKQTDEVVSALPPPAREVVDGYAATLRSIDDEAVGGQMIPAGDGAYKRTSEHSPFYRQYFKENGRKPSQQAYKEEAERQLAEGRADPAFQPYFDDAMNPETQNLLRRAEEGQLNPEQPVGQFAQQPIEPAPGLREATLPKGTGERERGFVKNVREAPSSTAQTKEVVEELPQTYFQKPNPELVAKVKPAVDNDPEGALAKLFTTERFNDEDVATANLLLGRAQKAGDGEQIKRITDFLSDKLLESGRTSQAAALWGRLTPEGVLRLASRKIRKTREATPDTLLRKGVDSEEEVAKGIRKVVDETDIDKKAIKRTVSDVADDVEDLSTGERVAKKVESAVTPKVKKKADTLVNEITKKIKQEQMVPLPKPAKKSATDVLREVFGRNKEAQDAFPEAQRILREKFADNPAAQKTLDKFFNSELGLPAASSTIDDAMREQLKANKKRVSEIIYESWVGQKKSVDDVAQALVKEGFDESSAKTLAKEVTDRLETRVGEAKKKALERLSEEAPKKTQKVYGEKLAKLSNLGALDDADYLALARGKLKLPQLTNADAKELSELAQKMQGLDDADPAKYRIIQEISKKIEDITPSTRKGIVGQVGGVPRSVMASIDISGMGRQGIVLGTRFPKEFAKAFGKQVKLFASDEAYKQGMAEIAARSNREIYDRMGLALTGTKGYGKPEEVFASTLAEKIPGAGRGVRASDRAYTGALTQLRADAADHIIKNLQDSGVDVSKMPDKHLESLGRFINTASGRGGKTGGWLERNSEAISQGLFSPRLWKSRLDMFNPKYYYDLKGPARKLAFESAGSFAAIAGVVLGLAVLAGATVETDARSSDFLKIKVGDTRYDILGGHQQNLVFAHRFLTGEKKSSTTGDVQKLGEGFGASTRLTILSDLVQNKENPIIAAGSRVIAGKDKGGEPTNIGKEAGNLVTPLSVADTIDQVKKKGFAKGLVGAAPGYVGIGSQTYGVQDNSITEKQRAYVDQLKETNAPKPQIEATERFYQTLKITPSREQASKKINDALASDNEAEAQRVAEEYNKKFVTKFKPWLKEYGKYGEDEQLTKDFQSQLINLNSKSVRSRVKNIETNPLYRATRGQ